MLKATAVLALLCLTGCERLRVEHRFGSRCRVRHRCGALLGVDCNSAADGPYYYVRASDLEVLATCGGACMGGRCTNCPPSEWTCR